jgi:hypothetical protein
MPGGRSVPEGSPLSGAADEQAADVRAYAAAGLDELMLSLPARSPDELLDRLGSFMTDVVPRTR